MSVLALLLVIVGIVLVVLGLVTLLGGHLIWGILWLAVGVVLIGASRGSRLRL